MQSRLKPKTFGLCGLAQAIVDQLFHVPETSLEAFGLTKGTRTLIDASQMLKVFDRVKDLPCQQACGGSLGNSLAAFSVLGGRSALLSSVGADPEGKIYREHSEKCGIKCSINVRPDQPTGKCLILVTPDGARTMLTTLGAAGCMDESCIDESILAISQWVLLEAYLVPLNLGLVNRVLECSKRLGCKVALSLSDSQLVERSRPELLRLIGKVDLVFGNESEAKTLWETPEAGSFYKILADRGLTCDMVVTQGEKGALIISGGEEFLCPAFSCTPVDTTGAGDVFAGAFLFGLTQGYTAFESAPGAAYAAMRAVTQLGARLGAHVSQGWRKVMQTGAKSTEDISREAKRISENGAKES